MPVLHVKALEKSERVTPALKKTAVAIAAVYGCEPKQVWCTWETVDCYVEGEDQKESQPKHTHPPIAQLICFEGKSAEEIEKILETAAATLSEALGIPNNIFMTYHEAHSGRVIAGNGIIRK